MLDCKHNILISNMSDMLFYSENEVNQPSEEFVEHATEREPIGARVIGNALGKYLGSHITMRTSATGKEDTAAAGKDTAACK